MRSKRKYAGPPVNELRQKDQDPAKVAPHKKPKTWTLTVEWSTATTWRRSKSFTSKAARDEAHRRIERHFREQAEAEKRRPPRRRSFFWHKDPFADFDDELINEIKTPPAYTETYEG